jgi:cytidyltransferase-like protein
MRVYVKVSADLFHFGHVRFFRSARSLGDHLTVSVVPDERIRAFKGRDPIFNLEQRVEMVSACRWVDEVIDFGPRIMSRKFMEENNFQIYAFGAKDEKERESRLADCVDLPQSMTIEIPYTQEISSSKIRNQLLGNEEK